MAKIVGSGSDVGEELDFVNYWVEQTIPNEVYRGSKLREQKFRTHSLTQSSRDVIDIDLADTPCLTRDFNKRKTSRKKSVESHRNTPPKSPRTQRKNTRTRSPLTPYTMYSSGNSEHRRKKTACPLRVVELAAPTKRQCLETWKSKSRVLPIIMIERLRQQVMDEKPIVQIPDAINCFKKPLCQSVKRVPRKIKPSESQKKREYEKIQSLSAIFGHKLAQRLKVPMNIVLNPQLSNIANAIVDDISIIMGDRQNINKNKKIYDRIITEIANKVTIWIANILEDTSEKILEEDLRELEEQEGPVLDIIDDILDNVVASSQEDVPNENSTQESSKEDLTYNVNITPDFISISSDNNGFEQEIIESTKSQGDSDKEGSVTKDYENEFSELDNQENQQNLNFDEQSNTSNTVTTEIDKPLDSTKNAISKDQMNIEELNLKNYAEAEVEKENESLVLLPETLKSDDDQDRNPIEDKVEENDENENVLEKDTDPLNLKVSSPTQESENLQVSEHYLLKQEHDNDNTELFESNEGENELTTTDSITINQEENLQVSPAHPLIIEEASEDRIKKVTFSHINIGTLGRSAGVSRDPSKEYMGIEQATKQTDYIRPDIEFAPPNEHLLSNADESWPLDLSSSITKLSESVSRSVTSLGKIIESDENSITTHEEVDKQQYVEESYPIQDVHHLSETVQITHYDDFHDVTNDDKSSQSVNMEQDQSAKTLEEYELKNNVEDFTDTKETSNRQDYSTDEDINLTVDKKDSMIQIENVKINSYLENGEQQSAGDDNLISSVLSEVENYEGEVPEKVINTVNEVYKEENFEFTLSSTDQFDKLTEENLKERIEPEITHEKFDYRVHPSTAPSWIAGGQGDPVLHSNRYNIRYREREIQKWSHDLIKILESIERWKIWLEFVRKYIIILKKKAEANNCICKGNKINHASNRLKMQRMMNRDTIVSKYVHQIRCPRIYKKDLFLKNIPVKRCTKCGRKKMRFPSPIRNK